MCILVCRELALILQCWSILTEDVNIARNRVYWSLSTDGKESFGDCNLFRLALLQKNRLLLNYTSCLEMGIRELDRNFNGPDYYLGCLALI